MAAFELQRGIVGEVDDLAWRACTLGRGVLGTMLFAIVDAVWSAQAHEMRDAIFRETNRRVAGHSTSSAWTLAELGADRLRLHVELADAYQELRVSAAMIEGLQRRIGDRPDVAFLRSRAQWYREGCDGLEDVEGYKRDGLADDAAGDLDTALTMVEEVRRQVEDLAARLVRRSRRADTIV